MQRDFEDEYGKLNYNYSFYVWSVGTIIIIIIIITSSSISATLLQLSTFFEI